MAARTFVETGASQVAIIDLNEDDSKRAATEMVDWFGEHRPLGHRHCTVTLLARLRD